MIFLNETKTTALNPDAFSNYPAYQSIRRDRESINIGGGILVLVRKDLKIIKATNLNKIEAIYLQVMISNQIFNIIACYKPPDQDDDYFLEEIDDFTFNFNLNDNLLIIGDINMNMLDGPNQNQNIIDYLINNELTQNIKEPTRICTKYYEKTKEIKCSESILDLVISNNDFISDTHVLACPFSDHKFVQVNLKVNAIKPKKQFIIGRNYSIKNIEEITKKITELDLNEISINSSNADEKWDFMRIKVLDIINEIAPEKKILLKSRNEIPWNDIELIEAKARRDKAHKIYLRNKTNRSDSSVDDYLYFNELKKEYNKLIKLKMINYFKDTTPKDFKNSKRFWEFYSSTIRLNSSKSNNNPPTTINNNSQTGTNPEEISEMFSIFFTSLTSESTTSKQESKNFIEKTFEKINEKRAENNLRPTNSECFEFLSVNEERVQQLIDNLSTTSGPGVTGISSKIIKAASAKLVPFITKLFNECIQKNTIPNEWKTAVVTPIYKKKVINVILIITVAYRFCLL